LYRRCDEVLHYIWDPIGVAGTPEARDEYSAYLPQVFEMIRDETAEGDVAALLESIQAERMGLVASRERDDDTVEALRRWRTWIWENLEEA